MAQIELNLDQFGRQFKKNARSVSMARSRCQQCANCLLPPGKRNKARCLGLAKAKTAAATPPPVVCGECSPPNGAAITPIKRRRNATQRLGELNWPAPKKARQQTRAKVTALRVASTNLLDKKYARKRHLLEASERSQVQRAARAQEDAAKKATKLTNIFNDPENRAVAFQTLLQKIADLESQLDDETKRAEEAEKQEAKFRDLAAELQLELDEKDCEMRELKAAVKSLRCSVNNYRKKSASAGFKVGFVEKGNGNCIPSTTARDAVCLTLNA